MPDAPIAAAAASSDVPDRSLHRQAGTRFTLLEFGNGAASIAPDGVGAIRIGGEDGFADPAGLAGARYDAEPGTAYLLRPDGYVAARFRHPTRPALDAALARAGGSTEVCHGAVDQLEFCQARRRLSRHRRGASRIERRAKRRSRRGAGSGARQSHRRSSTCCARPSRSPSGGCSMPASNNSNKQQQAIHVSNEVKGIELMAKGFASTTDMAEKKITFSEIGTDLYAFTAEGDPNSAIIVGDDGCLVFDAQATPAMANKVIERVRTVTDKPIKYVVLSHYHAVRVLGASAYKAQGIVASQETHRLIEERGQQDWDSEYGRFPRLFQDAQSIPGLTWPTLTFEGEMSIYLGKREVRLMQLGAGHTSGDIVAWVPDAEVMFSGDLIEYHSACYCGDAHLREWPMTLNEIRAFNPKAIAPGRGDALKGWRPGATRSR
jgi:glyoxylase-like metal-dependent hydrolase (beta-lactamase superfamily II)